MVFKVPDLRKHQALFWKRGGPGQMSAVNSTETAEHGSMTH